MDANDTKPAEEWSVDELMGWIEQKRHGLLTEDDREIFIMNYISGDTFLHDGNRRFFKECGLSPGKAVTLARLSRELAKERNIQQTEDADMSGTASLSYDGVAKLIMALKREGSGLEEMTAGIKSKFGNREQVESAEPSSKRRRLEDAIPPSLISLAEKARNQRGDLREQHTDPKELYGRLTKPALVTRLPFPFPGKGKPTDRFTILDGGHWYYMGREYFTTLLNEVTELTKSETRELSLYGTIGFGKSHLLAALVCYLTVVGQRVVYIPDCRECCKDPFGYFQAAMLFAWADDSKVQEHIMELEKMEHIHRFFQFQSKILFIVDQTNALDLDGRGGDTVLDEIRKDVRKWINAFTANHKVVYSASANYQARARTAQKQTNDMKLYVYGGLSDKEMEQWWIRKKEALPNEYKADDLDEDKAGDLETFKSEIEDITGRIPLLLDRCIVKEKIDPSAPKLNEVFSQVQEFMLRIQKEHKEYWDVHCKYVTACIINRKPPGLPLEHIDHRYFYVKEDGTATYACGIAREAAAKRLREYDMTEFASLDSLDTLEKYINNPSITGFFIEHAVLSSIVMNGLGIMRVEGQVRQEIFDDDYPVFNKSRRGWTLYCPLRFNYPAIDAILVQFSDDSGKKKCSMYPIQVTVAKSHADSEQGFLNQWEKWTLGLNDYDIEVTFCWITAKPELESGSGPPSSRSLRSKEIVKPGYKFTRIPLDVVSKDIWKKYDQAIKARERAREKAAANDAAFALADVGST